MSLGFLASKKEFSTDFTTTFSTSSSFSTTFSTSKSTTTTFGTSRTTSRNTSGVNYYPQGFSNYWVYANTPYNNYAAVYINGSNTANWYGYSNNGPTSIGNYNRGSLFQNWTSGSTNYKYYILGKNSNNVSTSYTTNFNTTRSTTTTFSTSTTTSTTFNTSKTTDRTTSFYE